MKNWMIGLSGFIILILLIADRTYMSGIYNEEKDDPVIREEASFIPQKDTPKNLFADEAIDYALNQEKLYITFNKGEDWAEVPIKPQMIISDQGYDNDELPAGSYLLTEERVAFLSSVGRGDVTEQLQLIYSVDQGKTWKKSEVDESYYVNRFRKIDFLDDQFGYIITTGEKIVAQEMVFVYITTDGGQSWKPATDEQLFTRLITEGGFINTETGFLSMSGINPSEPELMVTHNTGKTWQQAVIEVPEEYREIFVQAEMPYKEDDHLAVLVNQGPNGDYKGAKVKGKFISADQGVTWRFSTEVESDGY